LLLLPFSVLAPSLKVRGSKPFERNHKTLFLSLSEMRKKTCGFKPLGLAAGSDGYGYVASSKTFPRTDTSLSPLSFPPPLLSLLSLSRGSKAKRKQAHEEQSTHQRVWEIFISGRYIRAE
jgi:hypothetical protein